MTLSYLAKYSMTRALSATAELFVDFQYDVTLLSRVSTLTRNIGIASLSVRPSFCLCVRPSAAFRYSMKTVNILS